MNEFEQCETVSGLIRLAVADVEAVFDQRDKYIINMFHWHRPSFSSKKCVVCFAGSVIANRFKLSDKIRLTFESTKFSKDDWKKFQVLDRCRRGMIHSAITMMYQVPWDDDQKNCLARTIQQELKVTETVYINTPSELKKFSAQMNRLANVLEQVGW